LKKRDSGQRGTGTSKGLVTNGGGGGIEQRVRRHNLKKLRSSKKQS